MQSLCIDFDGVIHSYEKGWGNGSIYGTVTHGFWEWAIEAEKHFKLIVYSTRSATPGGRSNMRRWLKKQWDKTQKEFGGDMPKLEFASKKPPVWLTIDDRAVCFTGDWSALSPEMIFAFKPWNAPVKKDDPDAHRQAEIL
jgi:hypothetical protein